MATYSITEDPNNKWVKLITINTKYDIDISNDVFNITVKDQLEYFIGSHIKDGSTFELEELFQKDTFPTLVLSNKPVNTNGIIISNVLDYCNSDYDSLVKNGIQFWVDGVNKRTLTIRVVTKGKSTINEKGYEIWDPIQNKYVNTGYVGFTIAHFNITLNKNEQLVFNCFLMPIVNMGDPIPYDKNYTVPSAWEESPHILSANIRTDYDWNDDSKGMDNLYVNNTIPNKSSAYYYEQYSDDEYGIYWHTSPASGLQSFPTPIYCVKSSAYVTDYLKTGSATDLYLSTEDDIVSACRDFDFTSASVNSYLINEFSKKKINLSADFSAMPSADQIFIESNGECIHDGIYCYEITQYIYDSSCSGIIRDNQVKLELEI